MRQYATVCALNFKKFRLPLTLASLGEHLVRVFTVLTTSKWLHEVL